MSESEKPAGKMSDDENPTKGRPPIKMRGGSAEKIKKPRNKKFDCHDKKLREYTQLLHMIGAKHPRTDPDDRLGPSSALDGLLNAIACLCVLEREVVCVMPKRLSADKLLGLVVAQHDSKITDTTVYAAKGPGSVKQVAGHDEPKRIAWNSLVAPRPTIYTAKNPHQTG